MRAAGTKRRGACLLGPFRIAWLWASVSAAICAAAIMSSSIGRADEASDQALRHRGDGYVVHLKVARHGNGSEATTARKDQKVYTVERQWNFAPTEVSVTRSPKTTPNRTVGSVRGGTSPVSLPGAVRESQG